MEEIGRTLRKTLRENKVSVKRLSEFSGISRNTMYRWIRGGDAIADCLLPLADAMDQLSEGMGGQFLTDLIGRPVGGPTNEPPCSLGDALTIIFEDAWFLQADVVRENKKFTRAHISQWKTGANTPRTHQLREIAAALDRLSPGTGDKLLRMFLGRAVFSAGMTLLAS